MRVLRPHATLTKKRKVFTIDTPAKEEFNMSFGPRPTSPSQRTFMENFFLDPLEETVFEACFDAGSLPDPAQATEERPKRRTLEDRGDNLSSQPPAKKQALVSNNYENDLMFHLEHTTERSRYRTRVFAVTQKNPYKALDLAEFLETTHYPADGTEKMRDKNTAVLTSLIGSACIHIESEQVDIRVKQELAYRIQKLWDKREGDPPIRVFRSEKASRDHFNQVLEQNKITPLETSELPAGFLPLDYSTRCLLDNPAISSKLLNEDFV